MTQVARLDTPLEALSNGSWLEDFDFFLVNEHIPETFDDGTVGEIALKKRDSNAPVIRLRTDNGKASLTGNRLSANWPAAEVDAAGAGTYDVQIRFFRPDEVVEPRLITVLNVLEGL